MKFPRDAPVQRVVRAPETPGSASGNLVGVDAGVEEDLFEDLRVEDLVAVNGKGHADPVVVAVDPVAPALADSR